jgi:hypothetical protein
VVLILPSSVIVDIILTDVIPLAEADPAAREPAAAVSVMERSS